MPNREWVSWAASQKGISHGDEVANNPMDPGETHVEGFMEEEQGTSQVRILSETNTQPTNMVLEKEDTGYAE